MSPQEYLSCRSCPSAQHVAPVALEDILWFSVEHCFYVDNCLQSVSTPTEAKQLVDRLRDLLSSAGFKLRQWACNVPSVVDHLPQEAQSQRLPELQAPAGVLRCSNPKEHLQGPNFPIRPLRLPVAFLHQGKAHHPTTVG